jgi:hypothetical protein
VFLYFDLFSPERVDAGQTFSSARREAMNAEEKEIEQIMNEEVTTNKFCQNI